MIAEAQAKGDITPAGLLRLMRPRSSIGNNTDAGGADSEDEADKNTARQSSIPAKQVILTSDEIEASAAPLPATDHIYQLNKPDVDDSKETLRQTGPGEFAYQLFRTFVHGLDYIDELVFMSDQYAFYYPIQDANYNVIAIEGSGLLCEYDPYGRMRVRDPHDPNGDWIDHEYNPISPTFWTLLLRGRHDDIRNTRRHGRDDQEALSGLKLSNVEFERLSEYESEVPDSLAKLRLIK